MARQFIYIDDIVNDYMLTKDEDDYAKITSRSKVRSLALAALRDMQYDSLKTFKAVRLEVDKNRMSIDFPEDYIRYIKIGVLNNKNQFITLVENRNLPNLTQEYILDSSNEKLLDSDGLTLTSDMDLSGGTSELERYTYRGRYSDGSRGALYGISGGKSWAGSYREDTENNRIFFSSDFPSDIDHVIIEYLADETMNSNPRISSFAYDAAMNYIYYKHIQRKSNVNLGEKRDAKRNYAIEKRKVLARLGSKTKAELLSQFWNANSQNAPRTGGRIYY